MSKIRISPDKKLAINDAIDRLLRLAGLPEHSLGFSFSDQIDEVYSVTSSDMDLYVDPVNGNDNNTGTSVSPFQTIQAALNIIPKTIRHKATVHLASGDYYVPASASAYLNALVNVSGFSVDTGVNYDAYLLIDGATTEVLAPVNATSYTAPTSTSPGKLFVSTASWTPSAYKGMFVEIISGTGAATPGGFSAGGTYPIIDNDATSLQLVGTGTLDSTTYFHIIKPISNLHNTKVSAPTTNAVRSPGPIILVNSCQGIYSSVNPTISSNGTIVFRHLSLKCNGGTGLSINQSTGVELAFSSITSTSAFQDVALRSCSDCYLTSNYMDHGGGSRSIVPVENSMTTLNSNVVVNTQKAFTTVITGNGTPLTIYSSTNYFSTSSHVYDMPNQGRIYSTNDMFVQSGGVAFNASVAGVYFNVSTAYQYGTTPSALAIIAPGSSIQFDSATTTNAANFISLDNGATYTTKATIEAGTAKTVMSSIGAIARET